MLLSLLFNVLAATATLAAPTIFLAGDSTMTAKGNNDGTAGWGVFLNNYTTLAIENDAVAGRSARSFTREGRFTAMAGTHFFRSLSADVPTDTVSKCEFGRFCSHRVRAQRWRYP